MKQLLIKIYLFFFNNLWDFYLSIKNIFNTFFSFFSKIFTFNVIKQISDSFLIGTLFLVFFKIVFGTFSPIYNFSLLFVFSFFCFYYNFYLKIKNLIVAILQKTLPLSILTSRDETVDDFILLWDGCVEKQNKFKKLKQNRKYEIIILYLFFVFIYLRLLLLLEPIIYIIYV